MVCSGYVQKPILTVMLKYSAYLSNCSRMSQNSAVKTPSLLGGMMIVAGTAIGAGMFANPTATAGVWYVGSIVVMAYTWFCMCASGLMIMEANQHYPAGASFNTMVKDLLGPVWNAINGLAFVFVIYILLYAYIFVGGSMLEPFVAQLGFASASAKIAATVFVLAFALCVWWSTKAVDCVSTVLIVAMVITFITSVTGMLNQLSVATLMNALPEGAGSFYLPYVWVALPVCLASFGFHMNVPSLMGYYQNNTHKVHTSVIGGTLIALLIYCLWQTAVQGVLPRHEFAPVITAGGDVPVLLNALSAHIDTLGLNQVLNAFAFMAIVSSFLGVSLGLFDYASDLFHFKANRTGRFKSAAITFVPPYLACILFPTGFVTVIGYVGLGAAVWTAVIPVLMVMASRRRFPVKAGDYTVKGGKALLWFVLMFGIVNIVAQILTQFGWLPTFKG